MARTKSLNIEDYLTEEVMDNLAETLDGVVENIQTTAVSEALKAKNGSGDPTTGSVEYKRFANAKLEDKGTARAAGKGNKVKAKPVIINIDDDKEIIEELQAKDIKLYGIDGMAEKRKKNFKDRVRAYLDRKFFDYAAKVGTKVETEQSDPVKIIDEAIVKAKNTQSDFIDGIDAEDLALVVNGTYRKALKSYLDELPNGTEPSNGAIGMYDSLITYESNRLPEGVNYFVMLKESIAFPNYLSDYDAEKIPFDDAVALETFIYNGIGALNEEAIYYGGNYENAPEITEVKITNSKEKYTTSDTTTGTVVATISVTGGTEPFSYELDGTHKDKFEIEGTNIKAKESLTAETYTATVKVTDKNSKTGSGSLSITVDEE